MIDTRIIVEGVSDIETLSKAIQDLALGSEFGVTISSIIPTTNVEIAKKSIVGADIVLIATDADRPGRELSDRLFEELKGNGVILERVKFPKGRDLEHTDLFLVSKEIKNSLVRIGLKSLKSMGAVIQKEKLIRSLEGELSSLKNENEDLNKKIKTFEETLDGFEGEKDLITKLEEDIDRLNVEKNEIELENSELKKELTAKDDKIFELEARYKDLEAKILNIFDLESYWSKISNDQSPTASEIRKAIGILGLDRVEASDDFIVSPSEENVFRVLKLIKMGRELNKN
ncbi:MAG: Toprim domain protein [Candidatus Methanofastidiosum methylothiophilum]|uniref:Toprim domain protein n=1 Tax=Candidatus Methanofastidiosum methylothiophilum TaxID=1705564 RepID=A0A150IH23_9EURY|nr:MAG: Toprim domain protein [Candidatus Methanofastidiosum methylthiophilus]KYC48790.1 MAG: Toprim domain protein [Candidatus Methanofastidiosum methylthiophilus]KYC51438.1 MAG: Toprim domain protein [Candidatus Methanofastidiosum methylthiophilus]